MRFAFLLLFLILAACATPVAVAPTVVPTDPPTAVPTDPPTATVAPTDRPTATLAPEPSPTLAPSATLEPTPEPTATPALVLYKGAPEGRDAAGAFALGDPSAPRILYEYSDFL